MATVAPLDWTKLGRMKQFDEFPVTWAAAGGGPADRRRAVQRWPLLRTRNESTPGTKCRPPGRPPAAVVSPTPGRILTDQQLCNCFIFEEIAWLTRCWLCRSERSRWSHPAVADAVTTVTSLQSPSPIGRRPSSHRATVFSTDPDAADAADDTPVGGSDPLRSPQVARGCSSDCHLPIHWNFFFAFKFTTKLSTKKIIRSAPLTALSLSQKFPSKNLFKKKKGKTL